jgi:hypothetical protein
VTPVGLPGRDLRPVRDDRTCRVVHLAGTVGTRHRDLGVDDLRGAGHRARPARRARSAAARQVARPPSAGPWSEPTVPSFPAPSTSGRLPRSMADRPLAFWLALVDRLVEEKFSERSRSTASRARSGACSGSSRGARRAPPTSRAPSPTCPGCRWRLGSGRARRAGGERAGSSRTATTPSPSAGAAAYERLADVVDELRATLTSGLTDDEQAATASPSSGWRATSGGAIASHARDGRVQHAGA